MQRRALLWVLLASSAAGCASVESAPMNAGEEHEGETLASVQQALTPIDYESTVLQDGPSAYYRLGEKSGPIAFDRSKTGRNGAYRGSYADSWPPQLKMPGAIGDDPDTAARFFVTNNYNHSPPGQTTYVEIPDHEKHRPASNNITLEAWFTMTPGAMHATYSALIYKASGDMSDGYGLFLYLNQLHFYVNHRNIRVSVPVNNPPVMANYHHVVGTYDGKEMVLYFDGVAVSRRPMSGPINYSQGPMLLGKGWLFMGWQGFIDEAATYPRALTDKEVERHYWAARPKPRVLLAPNPAGITPIAGYQPAPFGCPPRLSIVGPNAEGKYSSIDYETGVPADPSCPTAIRFCDANDRPLTTQPTAADFNTAPAAGSKCPARAASPDCAIDPDSLGGACTTNADCSEPGSVCALQCDNAACANPQTRCGKYFADCQAIPETLNCNDTGFLQCPDPESVGTVTAANAEQSFPARQTAQPGVEPTLVAVEEPFAPLNDKRGLCNESNPTQTTKQAVVDNHDEGSNKWGVFLKPTFDYQADLTGNPALGEGFFSLNAHAGLAAGGRVLGKTINALNVDFSASVNECSVDAKLTFKVFGDLVDPAGLLNALEPKLAGYMEGTTTGVRTRVGFTEACEDWRKQLIENAASVKQAISTWHRVRKFYLQNGNTKELCEKANQIWDGPDFNCNDPAALAGNVAIPNAWHVKLLNWQDVYNQTTVTFRAGVRKQVEGVGRIPLLSIHHPYDLKAAEAAIPVGPFTVTLAVQAFGRWGVEGGIDVGVQYDDAVATLATPLESTPQSKNDARVIAGPNVTPSVDFSVAAFAGIGIPGVSIGVEGQILIIGVKLPTDARVALRRVTLLDTRDIASSEWAGTPLFGLPTGQKYRWETGWAFGSKLNLRELDGKLNVALRISLLFFSTTFRLKVAEWKGFEQEFRLLGDADGDPLHNATDLGIITNPIPFTDLPVLTAADIPVAPDPNAGRPASLAPGEPCQKDPG